MRTRGSAKRGGNAGPGAGLGCNPAGFFISSVLRASDFMLLSPLGSAQPTEACSVMQGSTAANNRTGLERCRGRCGEIRGDVETNEPLSGYPGGTIPPARQPKQENTGTLRSKTALRQGRGGDEERARIRRREHEGPTPPGRQRIDKLGLTFRPPEDPWNTPW